MPPRNLTRLPAFAAEQENVNVVVESVQGSRVKLDYEPKRDAFELTYVLPEGHFFPFEFGFVPSTLAEDGDPLDILVLLDAPTAVGAILSARPIGVIEARQTQNGNTFRNDRIIGVALASHRYSKMTSLDEVASETRQFKSKKSEQQALQ